ncbi:hypothetical protein [Microvirga yunnanensis]|nr:hypothetical protein [Microvirga sp. HBU65207]
MAIKHSHLASCEAARHDGVARRLSIPVVPTLLGALAILNVASVVMVLME